MYKIYINENCLVFADRKETQSIDQQNVTVLPFLSGKKSLLNYIDKLEKSPSVGTFILVSPDPNTLFDEYRSLYKQIKAAGGIIYNSQEEILFIERLNRWDLPKGKVDKNESSKDAAVREVMEETGQDCRIVQKAGLTWHTYFDTGNRRILKKTNWYVMQPVLSKEVVIQVEEDITAYRWMTAEQFLASDLPTYQSIKAILEYQTRSATSNP